MLPRIIVHCLQRKQVTLMKKLVCGNLRNLHVWCSSYTSIDILRLKTHHHSFSSTWAHKPQAKPLAISTCCNVVPCKFYMTNAEIFGDRPETLIGIPSTIYALSSGSGKCGVAVVRVSGPAAKRAVMSLLRSEEELIPRKAILRRIYHPQTKEQIDKGLIFWFPGPHSFTGEDSVELQIHGGSAVISCLLAALSTIDGLRHAEPGDFTKRAFHNGHLDLTEVEGLADLIHAETEAQHRQALRQMEGALGRVYSGWRQRLLKCTANMEAYIDFGEEDEIEDEVWNQVEKEVHKVKDEIKQHLSDKRRGERLRSGIHVAIIGEPNVGKSSLLNLICQQSVAIVSPIAGTTRDVIERGVDLGGYPVVLGDTAGLRPSQDSIEQEGVRRALHRARSADLKIVVLDSTTLNSCSPGGTSGSDYNSLFKDPTSYVANHLRKLGVIHNDTEEDLSSSDENVTIEATCELESGDSERDFCMEDVLVVVNKTDLHGVTAQSVDTVAPPVLCVSCLTEDGLQDFLGVLTQKVKEMCTSDSTSSPSLTQARHRFHLTACYAALRLCDEATHQDYVLAAHHLHTALHHIGKITGHVTSEEILDVIFRDFCIGK